MYSLQQDASGITATPESDECGAMIWLHGLGAGCDDFVPVFSQITQSLQLPLRGVFPQSPSLSVTINDGMVMPAWYDILAANPKRVIEPNSFAKSVQRIHALADSLISDGIASDRIVVAGFSQGGAVAMEAALTFTSPLAGLICLSTYMARPVQIHSAQQSLPVFMAHGSYDAVVPPALGEEAFQQMKNASLSPRWHTYPMQHEVSLAEIHDVTGFCRSVLSPL